MKLKCMVRDSAGGVHLIVNNYESVEAAYAELESEGYTVYAVNLSDENEFQVLI